MNPSTVNEFSATQANASEGQNRASESQAAGAASEAMPFMTERAARRIATILQKEAPGSVLRVAVNGGGCSGFQYAFDIVAAGQPDDYVIENSGVRVVVDPVSLDFLKGSRLDYVDDLIGQSFRIDNPNATSSCGCGTSFSL